MAAGCRRERLPDQVIGHFVAGVGIVVVAPRFLGWIDGYPHGRIPLGDFVGDRGWHQVESSAVAGDMGGDSQLASRELVFLCLGDVDFLDLALVDEAVGIFAGLAFLPRCLRACFACWFFCWLARASFFSSTRPALSNCSCNDDMRGIVPKYQPAGCVL